MNNYRLLFASVFALLYLSACNTTPLQDTSQVTSDVSARDYVRGGNGRHGSIVQWGGRIISVRNLERSSEIEILSFPLDKQGKPETSKKNQGRFLLRIEGFLEPEDYSVDRHVIAVGKTTELVDGKVGEADYRYPVLQAIDVRLIEPRRSFDYPRIRFGVGVGISL